MGRARLAARETLVCVPAQIGQVVLQRSERMADDRQRRREVARASAIAPQASAARSTRASGTVIRSHATCACACECE